MAYHIPPQVPFVGGVFLLLVSLAIYGGLQYHRRGHQSELLAFTSLMSALSLWVFTNIFVDMVTSVELKLLGYNVTNTVLVWFSFYSLLWFALAYSNNDQWVNRWTVGIAVGTVAVTTTAGILAPEYMYEVSGLTTKGPVTVLGVTFESWVVLERDLKLPFRVLQVVSYTVMLASAGILVRYLFQNRSDIYTGQAVALGVGIGSPLVANSLLFVGLLPAEFNVTDISFGITGIAFGIAIFRYRLLRIAPVGRQQLVDKLQDPVVMLSEERRVVDCNPAARDLVGISDGWRGMTAREFFAPFSDQFDRFAGTESVETEIHVQKDGATRYFNLDVTPITNDTQTTTGSLIVLNDFTDQKVHEQQLQRKNERLDRFASVVSHDLRNPLNVAQGRIDIAREERDNEHLEAAAEGIERSFELIDDLLALARGGQDVSEQEAIELRDFIEDCWETVETPAATIDLDLESRIRADSSRLRQLFENLFRNAVEHGGEDVTVTVGALSDGFYVADDGSGIPAADREDVFDEGFSKSQDGTGFGLAIVKQIVAAHDWTIRAVEAEAGGARFEITGVDFAEE